MSWYIEEQNPVYLDYNATTPLADSVKQAVTGALELWHNPSSNYKPASNVHCAIEEARAQVGELLHVPAENVYFTSGGTESNQWALMSSIEEFHKKNPGQKPHIVSTVIEHPSISCPLRKLEREGTVDITLCEVDPSTGRVSPSTIATALCDRTCLVTVMLANNETGVIQPIADISDVVRAASERFGTSILMHSDAAQAIGKIDVNLDDLKVDMVTVVGHKLYGPRIGALVVRKRILVPLNPLFSGCGQECEMRAGTENTPCIVGLGAACHHAAQNLAIFEEKMRTVRDYFEQQLKVALGDVVSVNFHDSPRLPNTASVAFVGYKKSSHDLLAQCKSFYASTSAAGHSKDPRPSEILMASGLNSEAASKTIRFSFGRENTKEEVDRVVKELKAMCFLSKYGTSLTSMLNQGPIAGF